MEPTTDEVLREPPRAAVLLTDSRGNVVACSLGFRELFGPPDQIELRDDAGRSSRGRWPPATAEGEPLTSPFSVRLMDGSDATFNIRCYPLAERPDGSEPAAALVFEEASSVDAPGQVVALVSHELRTPLTVLHAALQLLDRSLPPDDGAGLRRYLNEALTEARQLNMLTGQLLEATRIQSGRLRLRLTDASLVEVAQEACWRAQPLTRGQRIELSAPQEQVMVRADRERLEQMVVNLLLNAIMYAPGTTRIDVRVGQEGAAAVLAVQDYGAGIKRDLLSRVSQPFYQAPRRDRPSRGGLGLGLYLSRELARLHGGRLALDSREGYGSTFTLTLPAGSHHALPLERRRERAPVMRATRQPTR